MDIGQVHGAFVMGLGNWLTEEAKFDAESGRLLTHNTWVSCLCGCDVVCDWGYCCGAGSVV